MLVSMILLDKRNPRQTDVRLHSRYFKLEHFFPFCSTFRGFLARKRVMEQKIQEYTPSSRDLEWARKYKQDLKKRDDARKHKHQYALYM